VSDAEAVVFVDFCATGPIYTVLPGLETFQKIEFHWLLRMLTLRLSYIHREAPGKEDFDFEIFDKSRFYQLLLITKHYQATDPRDKLFGLLGVSEIGLLPDYEVSTKAVYVDFAKRCIREGRFDFLSSAGIYPASYSTDFNEDLPSWVPDRNALSYSPMPKVRQGIRAIFPSDDTFRPRITDTNTLLWPGTAVDVISGDRELESSYEQHLFKQEVSSSSL
jgi:hypothetical protein